MLICVPLMLVAFFVFFFISIAGLFGHSWNSESGTLGVILFIGSVIVMVVCSIFSFAVSVRRYHDRDKSGWWMLIALIPYIGAIWQLVELGILEGTEGANRYDGATAATPASSPEPQKVTVGDMMANA